MDDSNDATAFVVQVDQAITRGYIHQQNIVVFDNAAVHIRNKKTLLPATPSPGFYQSFCIWVRVGDAVESCRCRVHVHLSFRIHSTCRMHVYVQEVCHANYIHVHGNQEFR